MFRRLMPLVATAALLFPARGLPQSSAQPADVNLGRSVAATCANCHGTNGHSAGGMRPIAGRPRAELVRALMDFREGRRPATIMQQLAKGFSEEQIEAVSAYLSAQNRSN